MGVAFEQFKSSIDGVKKLVGSSKRVESVSQILDLLHYSLVQFEIWMEDIIDLEMANQKYVSSVSQTYKKFMKANMEQIKKFQPNQMSELNKNLHDSENDASKQRLELDTVVNKMREGMAQRKILADHIQVKLKNGQNSPLALEKMLTEVKSTFSPKSDVMVRITQKLQTLEDNKREMRFAAKALQCN